MYAISVMIWYPSKSHSSLIDPWEHGNAGHQGSHGWRWYIWLQPLSIVLLFVCHTDIIIYIRAASSIMWSLYSSAHYQRLTIFAFYWDNVGKTVGVHVMRHPYRIKTLNIRWHVEAGYVWHTKHSWPLFFSNTHLFTDLMNIARVMCRSQSIYQTTDKDLHTCTQKHRLIVYITPVFLACCLVL